MLASSLWGRAQLNAVFGRQASERVDRDPIRAVGAKIAGMSTPTARERILEALQDLPDDATFDDAIERLVFLAKIDAGLAELDAGKGIPHEEVKRRLGL